MTREGKDGSWTHSYKTKPPYSFKKQPRRSLYWGLFWLVLFVALGFLNHITGDFEPYVTRLSCYLGLYVLLCNYSSGLMYRRAGAVAISMNNFGERDLEWIKNRFIIHIRKMWLILPPGGILFFSVFTWLWPEEVAEVAIYTLVLLIFQYLNMWMGWRSGAKTTERQIGTKNYS